MLTLRRRTTMTDEILKAYKEVESAVERYIKLLHDHVTMLQNVEPPGSDKLVRMTAGSKAMPYSAAIYLSYANYGARTDRPPRCPSCPSTPPSCARAYRSRVAPHSVA